ncbi:MAG: Ig-like domain-containing protein [Blautia sp.]
MKKLKRIVQKSFAWFLAVLFTLSGIISYTSPVQAVSSLGTVTVAVEKFSIGQGYLIEPYLMDIQPGDTYADICKRMLEENGYDYTTSGSSFYLSGIYGADTGTINIPSCIRKLPAQQSASGATINPPDNNAVNEYADGKGWLGEFSYNNMSGWMYSVGNDSGSSFPGVGMDGYTPRDGDVFRLQFSVYGYGLDLQGYDNTGTTYYEVGDKTALTRKIAQINQDKDKWFEIDGCEAAYTAAMNRLKLVNANQNSLDSALAKLPEEEPIYPEEIRLSQNSLKLKAGDSSQLVAEIKPDNANQLSLTWASSDGNVASVDQSGIVTAKKAGTAEISVTAQNGVQAVCQVTVEDRYIEEITLNRTALSMEIGETFQLSVTSYKPEDATEALAVTYKSDNTSSVQVDQTGLVKAVKSGRAVITVSTGHGVSAACTVTVGDARELADAIIEKISKLPDRGKVTEGNAYEVKAVWEEYQGLSDTAKGYVEEDSPEALSKLEAVYQEAEKILERLGRVEEVNQLMRNLPSLSEVTLSHQGAVEEARAAYDALSQEEQGKVDQDLYARLLNLERALEDMLTELESVKNQIQNLPDSPALSQGLTVLETWEEYTWLDEELQAQVGEDFINRLENAVQGILSAAEQAVRTDISQAGDFSSQAVQNFLAASDIYEALDEELSGRVSQEAWEALETGRNHLGNLAHTSGVFTMEGSWFIRLAASQKDCTGTVEQAVNKKYPDLASIAWSGTIGYQDIRSGETYEPEKAIPLTVHLSALQGELNNPVAVTAVQKENGSVTVKELDSQYDVQQKTLTFKTRHTGTLLILDAPIEVTGLKAAKTATVGLDSTYTLKVEYLPSDATIHKEVKFKSSDADIAEVDENGVVKGKKPGEATITITLKSDSSIKAKCKITVTDKANTLSKSVDQVMEETSAYMRSIDTNPTIGSEWFALGLARSGMDLSSEYFATYYNHVANYLEENDGKLTNTAKYTEYSKMALAMTSIGKDARDIAGYNLFEPLADFDAVTKQGFNGPIWALIAVNAKEEYDFPKVSGKEQTTEEKLIQYLLDGECDGGGWSLAGDVADSDITGMTLQALAPYYQQDGYEKVTQAVDRALEVLSEMQNDTGGYSTMYVETSESAAQVLTGLCALGIDPQTDQRFIKNGHWLVENLISYHIDNSGFMHVKAGAANNGGAEAGTVNGMATEQGYYALTAYWRLTEGKTSLYDMSDLEVEKGQQGDGTGTGLQEPEDDNTGTGDTEEKDNNTGSSQTSSGKSASTTASASGKKASASGKTAQKTSSNASEKKEAKGSQEEEDSQEGWSFDGEDYVPDSQEGTLSGSTGQDGGENLSGAQKIFSSQNIPYFLCIGCGAVVLILCIWMWRKNKRKA